MADYTIGLEAEHWAPGQWNPINDNTGVYVEFADGSTWSAMFFSYANITSLTEKNKQTGECMSGAYFRAPDMILVDEVSRERIEQVVAYLVETGEFKQCFRRFENTDEENGVEHEHPNYVDPAEALLEELTRRNNHVGSDPADS